MPKLVLIDGSSYLYRAFHALPPLTASDGTPTGALFGIVNMLKSSLKENAEYIAFVLDAPGPTFRDALYPDYKANRAAMPDDLRAQVEPMIAIVQALGLPVIRVSGVEADDVIGTYALQAAKDGVDVVISTGDKDFAQLVGPHITLTNTMTGSVTDEKRVPEKFGVRPDQIIDFLALMGDAVDNVKGVEKCGPKTAAKWLAEYGTLETVIANAEKYGTADPAVEPHPGDHQNRCSAGTGLHPTAAVAAASGRFVRAIFALRFQAGAERAPERCRLAVFSTESCQLYRIRRTARSVA
ncbi:MAG: polymerase [Pseudomonadota bacterium]